MLTGDFKELFSGVLELQNFYFLSEHKSGQMQLVTLQPMVSTGRESDICWQVDIFVRQ